MLLPSRLTSHQGKLLEAARLRQELREERRRNQRNHQRNYQNLQSTNQPQLFDLNNIEPHFAEAEPQRVLSTYRNQSLALQSRALWLLRSQRLQRWLNSPHSDAVLIQGNSDPDKLSPVSFFAAC